MKRFFSSLCALACLASCQFEGAAQEKPAPSYAAADTILTADQVRTDVALAREAFLRVHPGYTRYASEAEMDKAWAAIITRAEEEGGLSLAQFYLASELVLTKIRCDHTKAELPKSLREARTGKPLYLPVLWTMIEGRGLIEKAASGIDAEFGEEITAIDGRSLGEMADQIAPYIPVDGYTEWSRTAGISQSREFMGGGVDHFGALLWDVPETAQVTLRNAQGEERDVAMPRISFKQWSALGDKSEANFKDAVSFERLGANAGYLKVDTFVNYRDPVKPRTLFDPIFKSLRDEGRDVLVLDLRQNGGGSSDAQYELLANLITSPMRPLREMRAKTLDLDGIRPFLWTWDSRALDPNPLGFSKNDDGTYALRSFVSDDLKRVKPAKYAFGGQLYVLTSNTNSSGSTNMIAWLTEIGRATTVGEKTGGSAEGPTAGLQFTLTLPESGVKMRLPFFHVLNNVTAFEEGLGFSPDFAAPNTVEAFRSRRDPALEKAKDLAGV